MPFCCSLETMADVIHDHDYSQQIGAVKNTGVPDAGNCYIVDWYSSTCVLFFRTEF